MNLVNYHVKCPDNYYIQSWSIKRVGPIQVEYDCVRYMDLLGNVATADRCTRKISPKREFDTHNYDIRRIELSVSCDSGTALTEFQLYADFPPVGSLSKPKIRFEYTCCESYADFVIDSNTFENNSALVGGGVYARNLDYVKFDGTVATSNYAFAGGFLYVESSNNVQIWNSIFEGNKGNNNNDSCCPSKDEIKSFVPCALARQLYSTVGVESSVGGAMHLSFLNSISVQSAQFIGNSATSAGAISLVGSRDINFDTCKFLSNAAVKSSGGAIRIDTSMRIGITNSAFINNSAPDTGGSLYVDQSSLISIGGQKPIDYTISCTVCSNMRFSPLSFSKLENQSVEIPVDSYVIFRNGAPKVMLVDSQTKKCRSQNCIEDVFTIGDEPGVFGTTPMFVNQGTTKM